MAHSQPAVVMVATRVLALLCCAAIAAGMNMCAQYSTCGKCTAAPFCGWCSPGPIIYRNGSSGARCGDERDLPWNCPQHYSTETCSEGYHCFENNTLVPKCLAQGKGEGNFTSKTSCEKACVLANHTGNHSNHTPVPPPPPVKHGGFKCNITTNSTGGMVGMCLKVKPSNKTAPFPDFASCNSTCHPHKSNHTTNKTTHDLLGNWRGIRIDQAFVQGEYDFLFTKDGLTVSGKANATASTKSFASTAGDKQLWLTFTAGPDKGMVRKAIYSSGPDGPETKKLTIAMGAAAPSTAAAVAPASFDAAMMSGMVFFLAGCKPDPGLHCSFIGDVPAPPPPAVNADGDLIAELLSINTPAPPPVDPCTQYTNCSMCTSGVYPCGWCTAPVSYPSGGSGGNCAGQQQPDGVYHRGPCLDHICEISSNDTAICRHTAPGELGTLSASECAGSCKKPSPVFACSNKTWTCELAHPGTANASSLSVCNASCVEPPPQTLCNSTKFTCDLVPWGTPNATYNKSECARTCKPQYICNVDYMGNGNGTCAVVPYGHPNATSNKTGCEAGCQKKYQCSAASNYSCVEVGHYSPGADLFPVCNASCVRPPKHNGTPPVLQGLYRGLDITNFYAPGEWDVNFGPTNITIKGPNATWSAAVSTGGGSDLAFTLTSGTAGPAGSVIDCLYQLSNGPETARLTLAMGKPGKPAPTAYNVAMLPADGQVLMLARCLHGAGPGPPAPSPPGTINCDPNAKPAEKCPGNKPCPQCGKPACPCGKPDGEEEEELGWLDAKPAPKNACDFSRVFPKHVEV